MPRELPELIGEPLSWDGHLRLQQPDGSEVLIEKAISISDICPSYTGEGTRQCLLCFFDGQEDGPCVAYLITVEIEKRKKTYGICGGWETARNVKEQNEQGIDFLDRLQEACGVRKDDILKLLAE